MIYFFDTVEETELDYEERRERPYRILAGTVLSRFRLKTFGGEWSGDAMASLLFLAFGAISYCLVLEVL